MKKIFIFLSILSTSLMIQGCQISNTYDIITTLFPQYDIVSAIVKDDLTVHNLLPFGLSPHGFEITSNDRVLIETSNLFIYTSDELETWASALTLNNTVLNLELEVDETHHEHDDEHDVHFWTNPHTLEDMVLVILDHLIELYPEFTETFTTRANAYIETLETYSDDLKLFLSDYSDADITLYIAGHNAMAEFGTYFGISIESLFPDFIPDAELTSNELSTFIKSIKDNAIRAFFVEPLFDTLPLAANTIVENLSNENYDVTFYELHQFHNISSNDYNNNVTLFDLFEQNIIHLKNVIQLNYGTR